MFKRLLLAAFAGLLFNATAFAADLDVRDYFSHPSFIRMKISPDGEHVAFTYGEGDQWKLAVMNLEDEKIIQGFEFGEQRRVQDFHWASNERVLMEVAKVVGYLDNNARFEGLYAANIDGSHREQIFDAQRSSYRILDLMLDDPEHILISKYHYADEGRTTANLLDIYKGDIDYVPDQPAHKFIRGLGVDTSGTIRVALEYIEGEDTIEDDELRIHVKENGEWQPLDVNSKRMIPEIRPIGFSADNREMYFLSDHDIPENDGVVANDQLGLFRYDFDTKEVKKLFRHEMVSIAGGIYGPENEVLGVITEGGYPERIYLGGNKEISGFLRGLQAAFPGQDVGITSYSRDGKLAVARVYSDRNPGEFYIFDRETGKARFLAATMPQLKKEDLVPTQPVVIEARDGLKMNALLTLPADRKKDLPLVINVHGGPFGVYDSWEYQSEAQYLAAHGYATLQVNYRGSGNRGREFMDLGRGEPGFKMQDDLTDATQWAIDNGIADPDRICIYGGSYGGYAALMGVIREPDLYQCAIGYVGVYDRVLRGEGDDGSDTFRGSGEQRRRAIEWHSLYYGSDNLEANSPAHNVEKIKAELFIAHGGSDQRVPMVHYDRLTEELDRVGKDYIGMVKEDEGHGYQDIDNRVDFYSTMLEFLEDNIGD